MSLSKQLILLVFLLVVLLFSGTLFISVFNTRDYLQVQLASHAQDAATSLGLSASSHVAEDDRAMVTAMVNAMAHRGDYLSIRMQDMLGEVWLERGSDLRVEGVPAWFVRAFPLDPPSGEAIMMSGWRQVGRVVVVSHPGLAYAKLWDTARETLNWFLLGAVSVLFLGLVALRLLLRPLREVEWQAEAICNREFPVVAKQPFTLEFRRVVEAMNRLSRKVQRMLSESEGLAARMREQAYQDPVTGLANKRQFHDVLDHFVSDPEAAGTLMLLQLKGFKAYNQAHGYQAGDRLLRATADLLRRETGDLGRVTLAHLSGADFALLLEEGTHDQVRYRIGLIADALSAMCAEPALPDADVGHIGAVVYAGHSLSDFLSQADTALRQAQAQAANAWHLAPPEEGHLAVRSATEWREILVDAIAASRFTLLWQPVIDCRNGECLHHEAFLRLPDPMADGESLPAGVFMPVAESAGLAPAIDRKVIAMVLDTLDADAGGGSLAVNMSPASLPDLELLDWLDDCLRGLPQVGTRVILEWPEYGAMAHVVRLQAWIERLAPLGVEFSLDHFGKGFTSFAYLRSVKADYLKVDGSFMRALESEESNQFFLQTIAEIAHGLDMRVIAEAVETESAWRLLPGLNVDGGRGYWLGRPE